MSDAEAAGEGKVSGNQVSIPASVRRELHIEDGDVLRWRVIDGELVVTVVRRRGGAFEDFEPGRSERRVRVVEEHDGSGVA